MKSPKVPEWAKAEIRRAFSVASKETVPNYRECGSNHADIMFSAYQSDWKGSCRDCGGVVAVRGESGAEA